MQPADCLLREISRPAERSKTLVVTGCTRVFQRPFLLGFLPTLYREAAFDGDVLFVDYGLDRDSRAVADAYCRHVLDAHWLDPKLRGSPWHPDVFVALNRWGTHVADWLDGHPEYDRVFCCDAGDLWFQAPLDGLWPRIGDSVALLPQPARCHEEWFRNRLERVDPVDAETIRRTCGEGPTYSGGVIAGTRHRVMNYLRAVWEHVERGPLTLHGIDQLWHNYVIYDGRNREDDLGFADLPWEYNCIAGWVHLELNAEGAPTGRWVNVMTGTPPSVLHNAGHRVLPRTVRGEDLNFGNSFAV